MNTRNQNARTSAFASRTTTIFTVNVNTYSGGGTVQGVIIDQNFRDTLTELMLLFDFYAKGDYAALKTALTYDRYTSLSRALAKLGSTDPIYLELKNSTMSSLQGLQRAFVQNTQLIDTTDLYNAASERASILDNMDKLREYLTMLNSQSSSSVFGDYTISSSVPALIPPEYLRYIQAYGFPQDGVFDVTKLGSI